MAVFSGNGSATAPSFTFSSNTSLGIYRGGTDIISFSTAGTERARLDASGNLEIGGTLGSAPNIALNTDWYAIRTYTRPIANVERIGIRTEYCNL